MKSKNANRIVALDYIRVLAMIMIIVFHYNYGWISMEMSVEPILFLNFANGNMGHIGVSLFFILSGASLMYVYGNGLRLREYFYKRFLSIYPLYWIVYGAFFCWFYIIHRMPRLYPIYRLSLSVIGMDGYLNYWIPSYYLVGEWFVGCIICIYLIFPLLCWGVIKRPIGTALLTVALYIPYIRYYPFQMDITRFFVSRIPEVLFGMYFIHYSNKVSNGLQPNSDKNRRVSYKVGLLAFIVFMISWFIPLNIPENYRIIWIGVSLFLFLYWVFQNVSWVWLNRAVKEVSACSFSIFLVHHLLLGIMQNPYQGMQISTMKNQWIFFKYFLTTCIIGYIFYHISLVFKKILERFFCCVGIK